MSPLAFILGCIPVRLFLAYISTTSYVNLDLFGGVLLAISLGFIWLYFTGKRMDAPEAGGKTWWSDYRVIHGLFYLMAAIYAFQHRQDLIWIPLVMDVIFGIVLFFIKRLN